MITRQKLQELKKMVRFQQFIEPDVYKQMAQTLIESNLELLDVIDGGMDARERERQIGLGLADLRKVLADLAVTATDSMHPEWGGKALFTLDMVNQMVKAKGPAWHRKWDYYTPRIEEEFGE